MEEVVGGVKEELRVGLSCLWRRVAGHGMRRRWRRASDLEEYVPRVRAHVGMTISVGEGRATMGLRMRLGGEMMMMRGHESTQSRGAITSSDHTELVPILVL